MCGRVLVMGIIAILQALCFLRVERSYTEENCAENAIWVRKHAINYS